VSATEIRLRAYAVGFGDAMVLTARRDDRQWRMLVDCGVHSSGTNPAHSIDEVIDDILAEAARDDGCPHFDVIAASHRHRDHVSGFTDPRWRDVSVGEVWLPWSEHPDDREAVEIRRAHDALALRLTMAFGADELGFSLSMNSLSNARAMDTLLNGFPGATARFVAVDGGARREPLPFPGAAVWMLGPTRRPEELRRKTPPADERWFAEGVVSTRQEGSPFDPSSRIELERFAQLYPHLDTDPKSLARVTLPAGDALEAAGWLDRALNNTSLFFVVEIEGIGVLFPGDAQWGAWRHVLADEGARRLLHQVRAYKVSHHASHNGTPRSFAEQMLDPSALSLVSVQHMPQWANLPNSDLLGELRRDGRQLVRTDEPAPATDVVRHPTDLWVEIILRVDD
jgi:beta-lactamase superfamily II metal-dependent hydrolase